VSKASGKYIHQVCLGLLDSTTMLCLAPIVVVRTYWASFRAVAAAERPQAGVSVSYDRTGYSPTYRDARSNLIDHLLPLAHEMVHWIHCKQIGTYA
jgi:hypothetical protein